MEIILVNSIMCFNFLSIFYQLLQPENFESNRKGLM